MSSSSQQENTLLRGKYRILHTIGQGGFGRTFLAEDTSASNKPRCVIKQFFPTQSSDRAAALFRLEAQRLKELGNHPQIPRMLEYFEELGNQYIAQEFIEGENLEQELAQNGAFTEAEILRLLQNLLPVLQFVHDHQVIHRDIKPSNIIRQGDRTNVLVDFGAAKQASEIWAKTGTMIGSAEYVAPEQAMGKEVFQSDLYSLGVTFIHLLTQIPPFDLMDHSEGRWIWRDFLLQPVDEQLGQILDKLLERGTKRRYQSAAEVLVDLPRKPVAIAPIPKTKALIERILDSRASLVMLVTGNVLAVFVVFQILAQPIKHPIITSVPNSHQISLGEMLISTVKGKKSFQVAAVFGSILGGATAFMIYKFTMRKEEV